MVIPKTPRGRRIAEAPLDEALTTLYRFYDKNGDLLYVGVSCGFGARVRVHRSESDEWWSQVHTARFEHFLTRPLALEAERDAIRAEHPRYNIAGKPDKREELFRMAAARNPDIR